MIELKQIHKKFNADTVNETVLFTDFHFHLTRGEFVSVIGSNGSGKTTLLNLMAGTLSPDSGTVLLEGKDITALSEYKRAKRIGRVFQDPSKGVASEMTVAENLSLAENKGHRYGLTAGLSKKRLADYQQLLEPLGLGLENKLNVTVGSLSGGQRQALSLLMATMTPIDVLILDEHTAALDPRTADTVMELTDRLVKEKGLTAIMVTHNLRYALSYGTRLVMMHEGTCVMDVSGEEKNALVLDDVLTKFNTISIECGN